MTTKQATATAAVQRQAVKVSTILILAAMPCEHGVEAPKVVEKRVPIDLVAVLDVSGSMGFVPDESKNPDKGKGEQSRMDLLKAAMTFVVKMFHLDDRLAIVEFNHEVKDATELSEISEEGWTSFLERVNKLVPNGGTAFRPGLEKAVEILNEQTANSDRKRVGFIVFLSDGEEQPETISKIDWGKRKYPVHTFGFSKFHDSKALHLIAKASDGTYSFINQDLDKIKDAFAVCLGGLQTVVAVDVISNLTTADAARGVLIKSIDSGGYQSDVNKGGESGEIHIPILYADGTKNFIVHLRVPVADPATGEQQSSTGDGLCHDASGCPVAKPEEPSIQRPAVVDANNDSRPNEDVLQQMVRFNVLRLLAKL